MTESRSMRWKASVLAVAGGFGFWAANFAISLTPIAAEYRAALSISYVPMLVQALVGGLIIGFGVSYLLLRFYGSIPTTTPIQKSLLLSLVALVIVTLLIEVPAKVIAPTTDGLRYFLIAGLFNTLRVAALGIAIGYFYDRIDVRLRT